MMSLVFMYFFACVGESAPWPCNMPCFAHCRLTTCSPRDVTPAESEQSHNPQSGASLLSRTRSQSHQGCRKTRPKIAQADSVSVARRRFWCIACVSMRPLALHTHFLASSKLDLHSDGPFDLCFYASLGLVRVYSLH